MQYQLDQHSISQDLFQRSRYYISTSPLRKSISVGHGTIKFLEVSYLTNEVYNWCITLALRLTVVNTVNLSYFIIVILYCEQIPWIYWILYLEADGERGRIDDLSSFDVRQINGTFPINRDRST